MEWQLVWFRISLASNVIWIHSDLYLRTFCWSLLYTFRTLLTVMAVIVTHRCSDLSVHTLLWQHPTHPQALWCAGTARTNAADAFEWFVLKEQEARLMLPGSSFGTNHGSQKSWSHAPKTHWLANVLFKSFWSVVAIGCSSPNLVLYLVRRN